MIKYESIEDSLSFFENLRKELEENDDPFKLIYIDSITITNYLTKKRQTMKDLFFWVQDRCSSVQFVCKIEDCQTKKVYQVHNDLNHMNICPSDTVEEQWLTTSEGKKRYRIYSKTFCNPVLGTSLYKEPETYSKLLKGYLLSQNREDRYRSIYSPDIEGMGSMFCDGDGNFIFPKDVTPLTAVLKVRPANMRESHIAKGYSELQNISSRMKDDELYAFVVQRDTRVARYRVVSNDAIKEFENDKFNSQFIIVEGYPTFTKAQLLKEEVDIPLEKRDALVIGVGSANSGVLSSLGRSNYITTYTLVDPDQVEEKNLRNQLYDKFDVFRSKVQAMKNILLNMSTTTRDIESYATFFQSSPLRFKEFKYIFCGLDSIKARQELLQYILDNKIKGKYLIDTRYNDQTSSIYFIDLTNKDEVELYKQMLDADGELLKDTRPEPEPFSEEEMERIALDMIDGRCAALSDKYIRACLGDGEYGVRTNNLCSHCGHKGCGSPSCKHYIKEALSKCRKPVETTCLKQNIIGIYNYTGAYVYQILKEIETKNTKSETYIELACETVPQSMVIRK